MLLFIFLKNDMIKRCTVITGVVLQGKKRGNNFMIPD